MLPSFVFIYYMRGRSASAPTYAYLSDKNFKKA